jgi:hypothetical protein
MRSMQGVITIVQEGRFQLVDDDGVAHHFLLGHKAALEPEQLPGLLMRRIRVDYHDPSGIIGHEARRILLLDPA